MTDLPVINCCTPLAGSSLGEREATELEGVMKALADRQRLRILNMLLRAGGEPICVCEFEPFLGLSQGTVSHHLKILREAGLIRSEKKGVAIINTVRRDDLDKRFPGLLDSILRHQQSPTRK